MLDRHTADIRSGIDWLITKAGNKCYWWDVAWENKVSIVFFVKGVQCEINLPTTRLQAYGYPTRWREDRNKPEIERIRGIWSDFYNKFKEKIDRIESGESTVAEEFRDGILLSNGDVGLKAKIKE